MTVHTQTPARAARRQLLVDRFAEYLTEKCGSEERATGYARQLLDIVDELGFALPAALEDVPAARPAHAADEDSPGRRQFRAGICDRYGHQPGLGRCDRCGTATSQQK